MKQTISHYAGAEMAALSAHPKLRLTHGPTPLELLGNLSHELGVNVWAKRDDCNGLALGGNKLRQLEYYFGQAASNDADTVLVTGALQSNFVRLTAAAARKLGWQPEVQLEARVPRNDIFYQQSGNVLLDELLGARIHYLDHGDDEAAADQKLDEIAVGLQKQGRNPYVIHLGAEHPPIGALGYVEAAIETHRQFAQAKTQADHVLIPSGSGLTHAGFLVGARAIGWQVPVHGICVRRDRHAQTHRIARRVEQLQELLGLSGLVSRRDIVLDDVVLAPGYGQMNDAVRAAIFLGARQEALLLDPVYSGRCMAGLIHLVKSGAIPAGSTVAFIHTGGSPGLFAYQSDLMPVPRHVGRDAS
ncbi:MAG: D-cysteine desulfhydrase family protein [Burkholderiaceae bacterium]